ncbi:MAG TPA: GxGYxYP domain-containing protein [Chthonomonadales bacterium]|nr:GxGYxYP domain-containing protein [Chthonomonadales bacterium]
MRWFACVAALSVLALWPGPSLAGLSPSGPLPEEVVRELPAGERPPGETFTLVRSWRAVELQRQTGQPVRDDGASEGRAVEGTVDRHRQGALVYGPYVTLPAGNYVAFFRLRLVGEPGDEIACTIDACTGNAARMLAVREVDAAPLRHGRWVRVPLAFRYEEGQLECRVLWNGMSTIRVDSVDLYRVDSGAFRPYEPPRVPQPEPTGRPSGLVYRPSPKPYPAFIPKSGRPAPTLWVCDVRTAPPDRQLLATTLQGIVNRTRPEIWCHFQATDPFWLDHLRRRGWVRSTRPATIEELIRRYRHRLRGAIVYDPLLPASRNVATMLAGVESCVVVSPRLAARVGLPIRHDLRGRWSRNVDAYRWALDTLWPRMNQEMAACLWHASVGLRDYVVQHRLFVFWLPGPIDGARPSASPREDVAFVERLLARMPPNRPILGYPYAGPDIGMGELPGVGLLAEFGKYLVGSVDASNLSVHTGVPAQPFRQPPAPPAPRLDPGKVYLALTMSDGDNLPVMTAHNWPALWREGDRGRLPIGWTIAPASAELIPGVMDFYYRTATPADTFLAAVSGVGYTFPSRYGSRYGADRDRVFSGFLRQTREAMRRMDLRIVCPAGATNEHIARYAVAIPELRAVFPDYARSVPSYADANRITLRNVPVFHSITTWDPNATREQQIAYHVEQIRRFIPAERPAFGHFFVWNWGWDLAALRETAHRLGPQYVFVSPETLARLYRRHMAPRVALLAAPPVAYALPGVPLAIEATVGNVTDRPLDVRLRVASGVRNGVVRPDRVRLAPGATAAVEARGHHVGEALVLEASGPFGRRTARVALRPVAPYSLVGPLPVARSLRFLRRFEGPGLQRNTGADEVGIKGRRERVARVGPHQAGHLAYGPYLSLPEGTYLACFILRRIDRGAGLVATVDTCLAGSPRSSSVRALSADDLPLGQERVVPLVFDHPGGPLETRVFWHGNASLALDSVAIFRVVR